jgi:hypothetical protein
VTLQDGLYLDLLVTLSDYMVYTAFNVRIIMNKDWTQYGRKQSPFILSTVQACRD